MAENTSDQAASGKTNTAPQGSPQAASTTAEPSASEQTVAKAQAQQADANAQAAIEEAERTRQQDRAAAEQRAAPRRIARAQQPNTIWVMAPTQDNKVAMYERDDRHPRQPDGTIGEVMVVGDGRAYEVGDTPAVRLAIRQERLVEVDAGDAKELNAELDQQRRQRRIDELNRLREAAEVNSLEMQGAASSTRQ